MSTNEETVTTEIETAEQAQELLNGIEQSEESKSAAMPDTAPTPQEIKEWELSVGGKTIKAKEDQLLKWASMGYDAPNQIGSLRKELDSWKQKETKFKEWESRYKDVDDYARQNPDWFQHVQQQYQQTKAQMAQTNPLLPEFQTLKEQVSQLVEYKQGIEMQQEDRQYMSELETIKKQYPKIDLHTPDEKGLTLEAKILQHALDNGIKKFSTAYRDYMHDELLKQKEEETKERFVKERQAKTKLGILSTSETPTTQKKFDHKGKSYNQLEEEIRQQYGLT